jgi:hypothetical protein
MKELELEHSKDLMACVEFLSLSSDMICSGFKQDKESKVYQAYDFMLGNSKVKFRIGKITPKKMGCFTTFYKRIDSGSIAPYDAADDVDFFVVSVSEAEKLGYFVFPKKALILNNILSKQGQEGKRAFRLYPLWDTPLNKQALISQKWQSDYFFQIEDRHTKNHLLKTILKHE